MITIVLLGCSISSLASDDVDANNPFTGERATPNDSVLIAFEDLRTVNSKLIELNYEKKINANLREVISNDSTIIADYQIITDKANKDCKKAIRQRNIAIGGGILFFITSLLLLLN